MAATGDMNQAHTTGSYAYYGQVSLRQEAFIG
jgi:hypothetical protein